MGVDMGKGSCYAAGVLVGIGWWILADGAASAASRDSHISFDIVKYLPGTVATLAFFLTNTVNWDMLSEDTRFTYGSEVATRARCFVVSCMALSVASLVASVVVFTHTYVNNKYNESAWPGAAIVFQNGFILLGTFVMRVGTIAAASTY
uniref:Transmembrane protein 50A n=1 Tax=Peronospora matthiolae TaxID=2874970 RepID=A0AAV1TC89_9STRA